MLGLRLLDRFLNRIKWSDLVTAVSAEVVPDGMLAPAKPKDENTLMRLEGYVILLIVNGLAAHVAQDLFQE